MRNRERVPGVLLILLAASLWASSGIFVNGVITNSDLSLLNLALLRDLLTFLMLLGIMRAWKAEILQVKKKDIAWLALMGGIGIGIFHAIWNFSVITNGMSVATMLQYNEAVIISIAAVFFFDERMHWRKVIAITGSLIGTALISGGFDLDAIHITRIGLIFGISSAVAHSAFSLFGKKLTGSYPASTVVVYAFGFAALSLVPFQFFSGAPSYVTGKAVGHLLLLVLGPTLIGFAAYTAALKRIPVSTAAVIATSEVPMAALFGVILLGESLGRWQVFGAFLVVLGVILVSLKGKRIPAGGIAAPSGSKEKSPSQ
jgi:DME family drug/metabolite transporter